MYANCRNFWRFKGNWGRGTQWLRQILEQKWKYSRFTHAHKKYAI